MKQNSQAFVNQIVVCLLVASLYSLALLSDAAHMFIDVAALLLGLFALWVASRPPSEKKTYGYYRAEILGALLDGGGTQRLAPPGRPRP